jgi:membrane-bound lytic murein transglycosylase B
MSPLTVSGLALILLAAGCAAPPPPAVSAPVAACAQTAQSDPEVKAIRDKQLAGAYQESLFANDYKQALNQGIDRCLAAQGLARAGGVEAVR